MARKQLGDADLKHRGPQQNNGVFGSTKDLANRKFYVGHEHPGSNQDRKSTRLNSSHLVISYAVFCLKKKKKRQQRFLPSHRRPTRTCSLHGRLSAWTVKDASFVATNYQSSASTATSTSWTLMRHRF